MIPSWLLIALAGYLLLAIVQIGDRFILGAAIPDPIVYVFTIGAVTGLASIPLALFVFSWSGVMPFVLAALGGMCFLFGLIPFFGALQQGEASRVIPATGGLTTIATFALAALFLGEALTIPALTAFFFLFSGYILMTLEGPISLLWHELDWRINLAGLLIGGSFVLRRAAFLLQPFLSGFVTVAFGMGFAAILLILLPSIRRRILASRNSTRPKKIGLVIANQAGGGLAGVFINLAVARGPVALGQAMQGAQYIFLLLFAMGLTKFFPNVLKETFSRKAFLRKS